jgi:ABC-type Fe3+ transport system substrate-binding protein
MKVSNISKFALLTALGVQVSATVESRTIDEIYQAALAEGGVVTCWHGGDESGSRDSLKSAFETRFPGMTLNVTVDLSKYHDGNIDKQIENKNVYVDSVILQTLHDYPRWAQQGSLLKYAPLGFDQIYPAFKDTNAAFYGVYIIGWSTVVNTNKTTAVPVEWPDFLKQEFKDKLVLTYPNDDDAVLYAFDLT